MAKSKTTIFRQLLISVLVPVILLIGLLSLISFFNQKEQIEETRQESLELITQDIGSFLEFFDRTVLELEKGMTEEAKAYSAYLVDSVFRDTKHIKSANLDSIKKVIGMPSNQDIYVIDTNGVIINTTFKKDLGLDFFERGQYYVDHFNRIWQSQTFIEDRVSIEVATNTPKKYTYQSTRDTNYIIELGIYSDKAAAIVEHFVDRINGIPDKYDGVDSVTIYFGTDEFSSYYQQHPMPQHEYATAFETLQNHTPGEYEDIRNDITYTSAYRYIEMKSAHLHQGYVVRIVHNNMEEKALVNSAFMDFGFNLLVFALPIFILILWRAKVLSRPIVELVNKTDIIRKGKLNERVPVSGRNEISDLGEHFNSMIEQLQDSYESLEQKVEERTRELRHQKEIVEEFNQEIMDSINYAKRIQAAILPPDSQIKSCFEDIFVLYKPKDVVAGDFYWLEQSKDWTFIAAADCTGHGVPGAMVSVVCNNALNRAVREYNADTPGKVLDITTDLVIEQFEKSEDEVKDGMDISLCAINKDRTLLKWAGANNPLWIIRKTVSAETESSFELIEVKADKQPIGKYADRHPFTTHEIQIESGDFVILSTDGFPDQFGGPKGKKLKSKAFKELVLKICDKDSSKQKEILNDSFESWRGDLEQIDDVCVIGLRL